MPKISGIELLSMINCQVILTTAYSEYALDGFDHGVADYLLKPITYPRFLKAAQKANSLLSGTLTEQRSGDDAKVASSSREFLFIKGEHKGRQVKIEFEQIEYIEALKNYVAFHCKTEKSLALMTMKDLESLLPTQHFARIHNSYIIPLSKVIAIESNQVILRRSNNKEFSLPIGVTFRTAYFNLINRQ
jgi:DNA-binding LytR/AlgR family response regulator